MRMRTWLAVMVSLTLTVAVVADEKDSDAKKILGKWQITKMSRGGEDAPTEVLKIVIEFTKDEAIMHVPGGEKKPAKYKLGASKKPKQFDIMPEDGKKVLGIYQLKGDTLQMCWAEGDDAKRPTKFESSKGSKDVVAEFKRVKK